MFLTLVLFVSLMGIPNVYPAPIDFSQELVRLFQYPYLARTISDERTADPSRGYSYDVDQSDGQRRGETGEIKNLGTDDESLSVKGYYSYVGPDGQIYTVGYTADENGFQPEGEHLPPAANVKRRTPKLGIPSAAVGALAGGGLGK